MSVSSIFFENLSININYQQVPKQTVRKRHAEICETVSRILGKPVEEITKANLSKQPSTQNRKVQILKIKQLATNALKKINEVLQKKEDKENFSQEMLKMKEIKQKQEDSLQKIIADYRSASLNLDLLFSRLSAISFKISCTRCDQERIDEQLSNSDKKVQSIQKEQNQLKKRVEILLTSESTFKTLIKNKLGAVTVEGCNEIKSMIQEKITTTFFECLSTIKQALKSSFQWGWSYIKENTSSVTWVALGSLFACIIRQSIVSYPITSIVVGGCVFFIVKDAFIPCINSINS